MERGCGRGRIATGARIAVQEYGRPNTDMTTALENLGASVTSFAIYRWELPSDTGPLREAARLLASQSIDVGLFTSVGPIMTAALESAGLAADIIPEYPKMAGIVKAAASQAQAAIHRKTRSCFASAIDSESSE